MASDGGDGRRYGQGGPGGPGVGRFARLPQNCAIRIAVPPNMMVRTSGYLALEQGSNVVSSPPGGARSWGPNPDDSHQSSGPTHSHQPGASSGLRLQPRPPAAASPAEGEDGEGEAAEREEGTRKWFATSGDVMLHVWVVVDSSTCQY